MKRIALSAFIAFVDCARALSGLVPLHNACSYGHYEVTELLVRAGADVNATDLWAFTPLHEAASKARLEARYEKLMRVKFYDARAPSHKINRMKLLMEDARHWT